MAVGMISSFCAAAAAAGIGPGEPAGGPSSDRGPANLVIALTSKARRAVDDSMARQGRTDRDTVKVVNVANSLKEKYLSACLHLALLTKGSCYRSGFANNQRKWIAATVAAEKTGKEISLIEDSMTWRRILYL